MTNSIFDQIDSPLMRARLKAVSHGDPDCESAVRLSLIELATSSRKFASADPGYWITKAKWLAADFRRKSTCYTKYVVEEPQVSNDEGDSVGMFDELTASVVPSPEQAFDQYQLLVDIEKALSKLTVQQQTVARMLAAGYTNGDIANHLHISPQSVTNITARMRAAMKFEYGFAAV